MNGVTLLVLYCSAILLASMAGGSLPLVRRLTHIRLQLYLSFASGVMLGAALCHMLPGAIDRAPASCSYWALAGLLTVFFLERVFAFHHHEVTEGDAHAEELGRSHGNPSGQHDHPHAAGQSSMAWRGAFVGLSIHTLTGGFALASAVAADGGRPGWVGFGVFMATLLHKPADSLTITSLMISGGAKTRSAHLMNFLFALIIPLGVVMYSAASELFGSTGASGFGAAALAFSAGTFLAIALADVMPELHFHRHDRLKLSVALFAGVGVMIASAGLENWFG